jgi:hypothetical protein
MDITQITGLKEFERQVAVAEREGVTHVALDRFAARQILDALKASVLVMEELVVGDEVEVVAEHVETRGHSLIGGRGTLINIEPLAHNYPYSVEFRLLAGLGSQVKYFARGELKKVS